MWFRHLSLSFLASILISHVDGYQIILQYQPDENGDSYAPASYSVISEGDDPSSLLVNVLLYRPTTTSWTVLSNANILARSETWTRSLTNISYPDPGPYTVRLVETFAPPTTILAESQTFVPPGFGDNVGSTDSVSRAYTGDYLTSTTSSTHPPSDIRYSTMTSSYSWYTYMPSGFASALPSSSPGYAYGVDYAAGPPIAAIIGGVLGALFVLCLSFFIFLCRRRRARFQKLKRQDSLPCTPAPMATRYSSSFFNSYEAQHRQPQTLSYESPSNPFIGGDPYPSSSALFPSTSTDPDILEELNTLRKKIKDLEQRHQHISEPTPDPKNGSTPLFLSYQHSGTESLPQYDSVDDAHNLYGHQPHTSRNSKTQCFCSSCTTV